MTPEYKSTWVKREVKEIVNVTKSEIARAKLEAMFN